MNDLIERIVNLLNTTLLADCPQMSGNMHSFIKGEMLDEKTARIVIEAPFYDIAKWKQTKVIEYTGEGWKGNKDVPANPSIKDYAVFVNDFGGFFRHNKSEHWVNRTCKNVMDVIGAEIGAEPVDNKLEL